MEKWNALARVEKTKKRLIKAYQVLILLLMLAVETLILFCRALLDFKINIIVIMVLMGVLMFFAIYSLVKAGKEKIEEEMLSLYQYIYADYSIQEDRRSSLRFDRHEEDLDEMLQHVPKID